MIPQATPRTKGYRPTMMDKDSADFAAAVASVESVVRDTAKMICAEQPDVPEPNSLLDLDSFSVIQVILELENLYHMKILEKLEGFEGETFRDLAEFIALCGLEDKTGEDEDDDEDDALSGEGRGAEPPDQPTVA